jgi:endonuclease/exonuclease/phosphatase family metal-dependent hydrolase
VRLRIATLNVWGLPWTFARDTVRRIEAIGRQLPQLGAVQEVWRRDLADSLTAAGRRAGLAHAWQHGVGRPGGGLLVLSRLPIARARFEAYQVRGLPERIWHADYHGGKGFLEVELPTAAGPVTVIDTHLHAQYGNAYEQDYHAHRMAQVVQLAARVREIRTPLVATGDFNFREDQKPYRMLRGLTGLRDVAAALDRRAPTVTADNLYRGENARPARRIDYVFTRDGANRGVALHSIDRIFDEPIELDARSAAYSDHVGLLAELELRTTSPSATHTPDPDALALARDALAQGLAAARNRRRDRRISAGVGVGGATLALAGARRLAPTRRGLLRAALWGCALVALPTGVGFATLAEIYAVEEARAFEQLELRLDAMR